MEEVNDLDPDMIVVTGDLVNIDYEEMTPEAIEILGSLDAPHGVVSVLGNHDVGCYIRDTTRLSPTANTRQLIGIQRRMGWCMLQDSTMYVHRGDDAIAVTGLSFDYHQYAFRHAKQIPVPHIDKAYGDVSPADFDITLSHVPQTWDTILADGRGDVTLVGHVHAMQAKVHLFGRDFSPATLLYDRWSGRYDETTRFGAKTLYINDGIGCAGIPIRIGARPEITVFTLESR